VGARGKNRYVGFPTFILKFFRNKLFNSMIFSKCYNSVVRIVAILAYLEVKALLHGLETVYPDLGFFNGFPLCVQ
jgi:hypothetical protein